MTKKKAIFLDRDGVINEEVSFIRRVEDFKFFPYTAKAIKAINNSDFLAVVITNQSAVARNICSIEDVENIHKKMESLLEAEKARLDAIYFCPHYPGNISGGNPKYNIECDCRKPDIGMLKKAVEELNIDLKQSFFIGDSTRDILCGNRAGTTSIALRTGHGCKGEAKPDYFFDNLYEAVSFIIDEPYKKG